MDLRNIKKRLPEERQMNEQDKLVEEMKNKINSFKEKGKLSLSSTCKGGDNSHIWIYTIAGVEYVVGKWAGNDSVAREIFGNLLTFVENK